MPDFTSTSVTTNVLKCPIILENGKKITYNIPDPKSGLTKNDLENESSNTGFLGYAINNNLILKDGYQPTGNEDPYYYTTEKIVFD